MTANVSSTKHRRLLPPICKSRGLTKEHKKNCDKELELMAYRKRKLEEQKTFTMKKFDNYFISQRDAQLRY